MNKKLHLFHLFFCSFIQGSFGIVFGFIAVFINNGTDVRENGFFQGYNYITWIVVFLQVLNDVLLYGNPYYL
jgi:hypothetical protein